MNEDDQNKDESSLHLKDCHVVLTRINKPSNKALIHKTVCPESNIDSDADLPCEIKRESSEQSKYFIKHCLIAHISIKY